jgi:RimJ/RimL family protein N-acetyltransferase
LIHWFQPEAPGMVLAASHVLHTGFGGWWADRWPTPRVLLGGVAGNYTLRGDPTALTPDDFDPQLAGVIEAPARFLPLLEAAFDPVFQWPRVLYRHPGPASLPVSSVSSGAAVRRLAASDARALATLSTESSWISKTWGSPAGLAANGMAWGAFVDGKLVSVACTFFVGDAHEELGVVTESDFRGQGLSLACTLGLCRDGFARGRTPTWSTSPDNVGSMRVAEKCGFDFVGEGVLYVVNAEIPAAPAPPARA